MNIVMGLALKRIFNQKLMLFVIFVLPVFLLLLPRPAEGMVSMSHGLFGLIMFFSAFLLSKQIIDDRMQKTIVRIAASPLSHRDYLLGHLASYMMILILQSLLFFLINMIFLSEGVMFNLYALVLYIIFGFMSLSFSLFWHTFFRSYATSMALFTVIVNIFALVGGLTVPVRLMPDSLQRTAIITPTYWYAHGIDEAYLMNTLNVFISLLILVVFAIIFLTIGSKRRFE